MIQYFYTQRYPADPDPDPYPAKSVSPAAASESFRTGVSAAEDSSTDVQNNNGDTTHTATSDSVTVENAGMDEGGDPIGSVQNSSETNCNQDIAQTEGGRTSALVQLYQDLRVYAIGEKYGIPRLKKKAEQHFNQELTRIEMTIDIFDIIREVYSITPSQDRDLREVVIARVYGEVQHWVRESRFMEILSCEGIFCADLLSYTVKEDLKQYEAALSNIQHPGYCTGCRATLITKKLTSKRGNVRIDKYCAKCDPWH